MTENTLFFKNMTDENISQEFRPKYTDETRNCLTEETNQNELMSKKHKKVYATLNYIEHFLFLGSTITGCISSSAFASLLCIPTGITGRWRAGSLITGIPFVNLPNSRLPNQ